MAVMAGGEGWLDGSGSRAIISPRLQPQLTGLAKAGGKRASSPPTSGSLLHDSLWTAHVECRTYSASHPSVSAAARNVRQASISPASDALAWLRACLATCQCGLFRSESLMYIMKE